MRASWRAAVLAFSFEKGILSHLQVLILQLVSPVLLGVAGGHGPHGHLQRIRDGHFADTAR